MRGDVRVFEDRETMSEAAAGNIVDLIQGKTEIGADFHLVLTGGSTPKPLYRLLGKEYSDDVVWKRVHFYWGDERYVPHDHSESNYRMAKETLLDRIPVPESNIHWMPTDGDSPDIAAEQHSRELRELFPGSLEAIPRFDLILLGMGGDGHVASLFPNHALLEEEEKLIGVVTDSPKPPPTRLTMTLPVINAAKKIYFLVSGDNKARAVKEVVDGTSPSQEYPASLVNPGKGEVTWWLDEAAARLLR